MTELESLGAIYWGQAWLDALVDQAGLDPAVLNQGETYAKHDWGLEIYIDKGRVEATAATGRRLSYNVAVTLPVLSDRDWDRIIERVARSSARTAALLDNTVDPAILDDARAVDASLLPTAGELSWSCGCRAIVKAAGMCKHIGAVLYLLADSFDEDPFDLLLLRGRTRDELRAMVSRTRSGSATEADLDEPGDDAWTRIPGPLPDVPPAGSSPGSLIDWGSDPPPNAPFTAQGLRTIGTDAVHRAWSLLADDEPSHLDLDVAADLARRAAKAEGSKGWKQLVHNSGLTSQELSSRAQAWRVAGSAGVRAHLRHTEAIRVGPAAQVRRAEDHTWFRFEKKSGRWVITSGPADDPETLLSAFEVTSAHY